MNWLLLRGLYRQQGHWHSFPERLARALPDARVHRLDLPGVGQARGVAAPVSVGAIREEVRARWHKLRSGHAGPWGLLSVSLGSMVALDWCAREPDDFKKLIVINTSARDLGAFHRRLRPAAWPLVAQCLLPGLSARARERRILELTSSLAGDRMREALEANLRVHAANPIPIPAALAQLRAAAAFRAPASVRTPTLVLRSLGDRLVDPRCGERLAARLGAGLRTHPDAGHDLVLDDPEWVIDQLRGFQSS